MGQKRPHNSHLSHMSHVKPQDLARVAHVALIPKTVMVFSFPTRLGGLGLPNPTMNYEKTLTPRAGRVCGKSLIRIDAFWENYDFGLEYQGKYGHSSHTKIAADIGRQLAAECMGIELQMLTIEQIRDFEQRMLIARKIASRVGRRLPTDPGVLSANQGLVDDLLVF